MRTYSMMGHTGRQLLAGSPLCPVTLMFNWGPSVHLPRSPGRQHCAETGERRGGGSGKGRMSRALCIFPPRKGRGPGAEERASAEAGGVGGLTSASRQVNL